jgi:biopolymer transport protein ExbD
LKPNVKVLAASATGDSATDMLRAKAAFIIMLLKLNRRCDITLMILVASASLMLLTAEACAWQAEATEMRIVDLQGDLIMRIDADGSVFDDIDRKVAVINDRAGTLTLLRDHQTIAFKNDPAVQRDKDRYTVRLGGESNIFEVKPDGAVLFNDKPWARVLGYTDGDAQKNRFLAAIVIIPFVKHDISVALPRQVKNADHDPAIRRQPRISIPTDDEVYVGDEQIPKADLDSQLGEKIDESLKRRSEANRIVIIAGAIGVQWGTIVRVIKSVREKRLDRIGLIVRGDNNGENRFLIQIPPERDPNEDLSKLKPNPLVLGVALSYDLQLKLITGGLGDFIVSGQSEPKGTLNDPSSLSQTLARIFQDRKQRHVYKPGTETRSDLPEDERIEKTVVIKVPRSLHYGDAVKLIDIVKGAGANPIILQIDDLPY